MPHVQILELTPEQISDAWNHLALLSQPNPPHLRMPQHLRSLTLGDWHALKLLLQQEMADKAESPVH